MAQTIDVAAPIPFLLINILGIDIGENYRLLVPLVINGGGPCERRCSRMGGKTKQAAGEMTDDTKMQTAGKMDQAKGKAQNAMGSAKDARKK